MPNVALLPHLASATVEGRIEQGEKAQINFKIFATVTARPTSWFRICCRDLGIPVLKFQIGSGKF